LAKDLKRSIGVALSGASIPASLPPLSVGFWRSTILVGQLCISQPPSGYRRTNFPKSLTIIVFALIESESLLIEIPTEMGRVNGDVSPLEASFQEAPEILDIVCVNVTANELDRVINGFVRIYIGEPQIRFQGVSVDVGARVHCVAHFWRERSSLYIGDMRGFDPASVLFNAAFDNAENSFLARPASALDLPLANVTVHVLSEPPNECFVGLNLSAHPQESAGLHGEPDAVIHEPGGLLSDPKRSVHLVAADSVLAVGDHPDSCKPLPQIDRAILEDRPDFCRELAARVLLSAFPETAGVDEARISATACRAANPTRPAQFDHCPKRHVRIGEVANGFEKRLRLAERVDFHRYQYDTANLLRQVYYYPILR
jgi:hypothetical protein